MNEGVELWVEVHVNAAMVHSAVGKRSQYEGAILKVVSASAVPVQ